MRWWSVILCLSVVVLTSTTPLARSERDRRRGALDNVGLLERFLLQRARVEAVKRGILQQLGLTEAPRPPPAARNRSSPAREAADGDDDDGRSVMLAYRRTVAAQTQQHHVLSNDVVHDVTGNDVTHGDAPSARQFYSFKGHGKLLTNDVLAQKNTTLF